MSKRPSLGLLTGGKKPAPVEAPPPAPAVPAGKVVPPWQIGKRAVTVWIDEEQFLRLNEVSKLKRKSVRRLVFEALNMLLPVYDKLPVEDTE